MPGPFPGVDPYLQAPPLVERFHERYVFHLGSLLQEILPEDYVAEFRRAGEEEELYLEIIRLPDEHLVAVIEVASPWNKQSAEGRRVYFEKQRSILASDVHLIEIDLLRGGSHWAAVPETLLESFRPFDYLVCTSRAGKRDQWECYFRTLREPLPNIAVPLDPGDADVALALQEAFDRAYDQGRYDRPARRHRPQPPLRPEDQAWADELLASRGLLTA